MAYRKSFKRKSSFKRRGKKGRGKKLSTYRMSRGGIRL